MAISRREVVVVDPTDPHDVLSASPASDGGGTYGTISVTTGSHFGDGDISNDGTTCSVCVQPGTELSVVAALADQLRGVRDDQLDARTVVATVHALMQFADNLGLTEDQTQYLLSLFTTTPPQRPELL